MNYVQDAKQLVVDDAVAVVECLESVFSQDRNRSAAADLIADYTSEVTFHRQRASLAELLAKLIQSVRDLHDCK